MTGKRGCSGLYWLLERSLKRVQVSAQIIWCFSPLAVLQDDWKKTPPPTNLIDYVNGFRRRLQEAGKLAGEKLGKTLKKMKMLFDCRAEKCVFSMDIQVLALFPVVGSPFHAKFEGPYKVVTQVSDENYVISSLDRRRKSQLCHIDLLKPYYSPSVTSSVGGYSELRRCLTDWHGQI